MATTQDVTGEPTILSGLADDTDYSLQNRGNGVILVEVATSVPDYNSKTANELGQLAFIGVNKPAGSEVYIWGSPRAFVVVNVLA